MKLFHLTVDTTFSIYLPPHTSQVWQGQFNIGRPKVCTRIRFNRSPVPATTGCIVIGFSTDPASAVLRDREPRYDIFSCALLKDRGTTVLLSVRRQRPSWEIKKVICPPWSRYLTFIPARRSSKRALKMTLKTSE